MTDHYDDDRRAMARCEEHWLREPAWRTGNPDGCDVCGVDLPDDLHLCDACAAARDDDFRATPYAVPSPPLPADAADVIPFDGAEHNLAALVRCDIATTARRVGLRCVAAVVEAGPDAAQWEMVSDDLRSRACVVGRDERATLLSAARAADAMRRGDVDAAALEFAEHFGLTVEVWAEETIKEVRR